MGCRWTKQDADPEKAWKAQNREQKHNPFYQLINLQKGGEIVRVYEKEGPGSLEKFLRREVEPLLYGCGQGGMVTKPDWIRFIAKCNLKLKGSPLDAIDQKNDQQILIEYPEEENSFYRFEEHEACWRLDRRGPMGETALHLLCLHNTPMHSDIARIMLKLYPKMALDIYEGDEYYGESALHLAIVYGDQDMVRALVENGADVNQRATGRFFLPEDQKKGPGKRTNYEGYAYYGEYPLAFAACFGNEEIYDYLIDHGADPNAKDTFGNTVLHMLVISNQINMFSYAVKHHVKKAQMEAQNAASLNPLTLASKLGRHGIFKEIMELQSFEVWRYSNITCSTYPLAPLDTIGPGGATNWSSALLYIIDGESDEHLEMLEGGVIKQLLDEKWKAFARRKFFERFATTGLYLILLSVAVYLRPDKDLLGPTDAVNIVRYIAELLVVLYVCFNLLIQIVEIKAQGVGPFFRNQLQAPAKAIFNVSCILILLCVPLRFTRKDGPELILLACACPMSWFFVLFFLRGLSPLGPFVIMIYKMCTSDILRFFIIFVIFLLQFGQGSELTGPFVIIFYRMIKYDLNKFAIIYIVFIFGCFMPSFLFLFKDIEDENVTSFKSIFDTVLQLVQMTFGEFKMFFQLLNSTDTGEYDDLNQTRQPDLTKMVFFLFALLVPILLLNMLIAMMGNTYQQVISRSEKEFKRQLAKIIIVLERTYSRSELVKFQEEYSVKLLGTDADERGLMVIKTSKKTKARQRKGAISNWKRIVKDVKTLIKEAKRDGRTFSLGKKDKKMKASPFLTPRPIIQTQPFLEDDLDADTDGLLSAMNQLAWERDLHLSKAPAFGKTGDTIKEDGRRNEGPLLSGKGTRTTQNAGVANPAFVAENGTGSDRERRASGGNGNVKPRVRSSKVAPDGSVRGGSESREGSGGSGSTGNKPRPKSKGLKSRTSSGEKDDHSRSPEDKKVFTISGSHSTTSLTSLLNNTWETKTEDTNV